MSGVGITHFKDPDLHYALNAMSANGDPEKAFDLLVLLEESEEGIIKDYNPNIKLLGAVNRNGVTCYLDATLFAMFARLESFEAILYNTFQDAKKKRLATLLRFWVNTLRVGKLITVDIVCEYVQKPMLVVLIHLYTDKTTSGSFGRLWMERGCREMPAGCFGSILVHY